MKVQITFDSEAWTIEGKESKEKEEENLLNLLDEALMELITCRELLARLRDWHWYVMLNGEGEANEN
jgi:hypothetical protein